MFSNIRSLIFKLDPETAHNLAIKSLKFNFVPNVLDKDKNNQLFATKLFEKNLDNPIGMAAGFDKNGEVPDALLKLGFGFTEIGTVTPRPQIGNPKPRVFRLIQDHALINRLGFNNNGQKRLVDRLEKRSEATRKLGVLGVNIGANKESFDRILDYGDGAKALSPYSDYLAINVSSPNTPGLRDIQEKGNIERLLKEISKIKKRSRKLLKTKLKKLLLKN